MSVNAALQGHSYPPSEPYTVGREKIREFALAVKATHPLHHDVDAARSAGHVDLVAPPTFAVVVAQRAEAVYIQDPDAGIDFSRVVHGEERFALARPIVAGDVLVPTLTVESVRLVGGNAMITTSVAMADEQGEHVAAVRSSLVVRGE